MPSSFRFRSIKRLLAAAALSSALCAQPIVRIASTQNVLKVVYIGHNWPNTNTHEENKKTETKVWNFNSKTEEQQKPQKKR